MYNFAYIINLWLQSINITWICLYLRLYPDETPNEIQFIVKPLLRLENVLELPQRTTIFSTRNKILQKYSFKICLSSLSSSFLYNKLTSKLNNSIHIYNLSFNRDIIITRLAPLNQGEFLLLSLLPQPHTIFRKSSSILRNSNSLSFKLALVFYFSEKKYQNWYGRYQFHQQFILNR